MPEKAKTISHRLNQLLAERDITANRVATIGEIRQSSLSDIINGKATDPRIGSLLKIAHGLGMSLTELLDLPPYNQRPDGSSAAKQRSKWEELGNALTPEEQERVRRILSGDNEVEK